MEDLEKLPMEGRVSRPASGSYGEAVDVERLKASLPSTAAGPPAGAGPSAGASPRSGGNLRPVPSDPTTGSAPLPRTPGGVPPLLARPTDYPQRPVSTPLGGQPSIAPTSAASVQQQRLAVIDALMRSPSVSEETKEWAAMVKSTLIGQ